MSEIRNVTVEEVDLDVMADVARELGFQVQRRGDFTAFGRTTQSDLVITGKVSDGSMWSIRYTNKDGQTILTFDDWKGRAQEILEKVRPTYQERVILQRSKYLGFRPARTREETKEEINIYIRR